MDDFENYLNLLYTNILRETHDRLVPDVVEPVSLHSLPVALRQKALKSFVITYRKQQGVPEAMGGRSNKGLFNGEGVYTYLAEHLGDLLNRMTQIHAERIEFGFDAVQEKVRRALLMVKDAYGFDRDIDENLNSNWQHAGSPGTFDAWLDDFAMARRRYVNAHKSLPVYNEIQKVARQIAIDHGQRHSQRLQDNLERLANALEDRDQWVHLASMVTVQDGEIIAIG